MLLLKFLSLKRIIVELGKKIFALMHFIMKIVWHVHVSDENLKIYGFILGNTWK